MRRCHLAVGCHVSDVVGFAICDDDAKGHACLRLGVVLGLCSCARGRCFDGGLGQASIGGKVMKITPSQAIEAFRVLVPGLRSIKLIDQDKIVLMFNGAAEQMFRISPWFADIDWPEGVYEWPILVEPGPVKIEPSRPTCEDCKFFSPIPSRRGSPTVAMFAHNIAQKKSGYLEKVGECRIKSPCKSVGVEKQWPVVLAKAWCGQFEQNPELA